MKKKFLLTIIILIFFISCGKKDDPEYKESKYNYTNSKIII